MCRTGSATKNRRPEGATDWETQAQEGQGWTPAFLNCGILTCETQNIWGSSRALICFNIPKKYFVCTLVCNYLQKPIEGLHFRSTVKGSVHSDVGAGN